MKRKVYCTWKLDDSFDGDTYDGSCGAKWTFIEGGPKENNFRFCPECGKPLKPARAGNGGKDE